MNKEKALIVIEQLKDYAEQCRMGLVIVGSVAYRSALKHPDNFELCDDLDCIFVYKTISDVRPSDFIDQSLIDSATQKLGQDCDLFATKKVIEGIKVSIDYVSLSYLQTLSEAPLDGISKYRFKLTDAVEVPDHIYCGWYGQELNYTKTWTTHGKFRIYKLPIHIYASCQFFAGVLLTKFLFNPVILKSVGSQQNHIRSIQCNTIRSCPSGGSPINFYWKKTNFSEETKQFITERMV